MELIDATSDSLTVTWPAVPGARSYVLEMAAALDEADTFSEKLVFEELSSKLTHPQAKKKNLRPHSFYFFKATPVMNTSVTGNHSKGSWTAHKTPFGTLPENASVLDAPETLRSGNQALLIKWYPVVGEPCHGYELQMRHDQPGEGWTTIAAHLRGNEVRKKNLSSPHGYQFRVRHLATPFFSPPSDTMVAKGLSSALKEKWFPATHTLLKSSGPGRAPTPISIDEALGGKEFVLLFVSANDCKSGREFAPKLANWYRGGRFAAEIVFVAADSDATNFRTEYFGSAHHPWCAMELEPKEARETLLTKLHVQGGLNLPRLVVVDATTGNIVEENAVDKPLVVNRWRKAIGTATNGRVGATPTFRPGGKKSPKNSPKRDKKKTGGFFGSTLPFVGTGQEQFHAGFQSPF